MAAATPPRLFVCLNSCQKQLGRKVKTTPSEMFPTEKSGVSDRTVAHFSLAAAANTQCKMVTLLRRESELHGFYTTDRGLVWGTDLKLAVKRKQHLFHQDTCYL